MSSNTIEQKRKHKAQQYFRDLLKSLKEAGQCDWPYNGKIYRVIKAIPFDPGVPSSPDYINALVKQPRKRGYKVTPIHLGLKDSKWVGDGPGTWTPQDKHILGAIIGEVQGPRYFAND